MAARDAPTVALPLIGPRVGDLVSLQLQVAADGTLRVSTVTLTDDLIRRLHHSRQSSKIVANNETPLPPVLVNRALPNLRVRLIGHSLCESKSGDQFIVYHTEYQTSLASQPTVTPKRFNDFAALHRTLSLSFLALPPFPAKTFLKSLTVNDAFLREREGTLTLYMQTVVSREDVLATGIVQRFLGIDSVAAGSDSASLLTLSDSEYDKIVDSQMLREQQHAQKQLREIEQLSHDQSQEIDLLTDVHNVMKVTRIDVDVVKSVERKEHEMQQTSFAERRAEQQQLELLSLRQSLLDRTNASDSENDSVKSTMKFPYKATLIFLTRSPIFVVHRALLLAPHLLFIVGGDTSSIAKVDVFFSSMFSSITSSLSSVISSTKGNSTNTKRETYISPEEEAKETKEKQWKEKSTTSNYPLGSLYVFHRLNADEDFTATLSLFFERELTSMAYDSKRGWLYLTQDDGIVTVFAPQSSDWSSVTRVWTINMHQSSYINDCLFSAINDCLVSVSHSGLIARFDVPSINVSTIIKHSSGRVTSLAYDDYNDRLFVACYDRLIHVYDNSKLPVNIDSHNDRRLGTLSGHEGSVQCLAYHNDSAMLVSGSFDSQCILWRVSPGKQPAIVHRLAGHEGRVRSVCFDNSGSMIASGDSSGVVCVWSVKSGMAVMAFKAHTAAVTSLQLTADTLVSAAEDKTAKVWLLHVQ